MSRAQSTIEYLAIIGAVITIALIATALITNFFGFFGPVSTMQNKQEWSIGSIAILEAIVDNNGDAIIVMKNNLLHPIYFAGYSIGSKQVLIEEPMIFLPEEKKTVFIPNIGDCEGECSYSDVFFHYQVGNSESIFDSGGFDLMPGKKSSITSGTLFFEGEPNSLICIEANNVQECESLQPGLSNLNDVDDTDKAEGKILKVNSAGTHVYVTDESGTDEKVKYDVSDLSAGYIADKFVAGSGISLTEGTGANENKLLISNSGIITETDPLSLHLDQTTPQTTVGTFTFPKVKTPEITSTGQLKLGMTGDSYGGVALYLQNRGGMNGALFQNLNLDLVDFGFKSSTNNQLNLRFEHRSTEVRNPLNTDKGEFQMIYPKAYLEQWFAYFGEYGSNFRAVYDDNDKLLFDTVNRTLNNTNGDAVINWKSGNIEMYYDLSVDGDITANSISAVHKAADGTAGWTGTCDLTTAKSITVKNGLITGCT